MNNTPDYKENLAFAPGDWSDSRVNGNTDRTATTIQLIEKIEQLEKENAQLRKWCEEFNALTVAEENAKLKQLLDKASYYLIVYKNNDILPERAFYEEEVSEFLEKIDEVLK